MALLLAGDSAGLELHWTSWPNVGQHGSGCPVGLLAHACCSRSLVGQLQWALGGLCGRSRLPRSSGGNPATVRARNADLDVGIRVSAERFHQLIQERLARAREGGDRWETLQEAIGHGRLHAGEAGISGIRKEIQRLVNEEMNLGFARGVQITVIREAGPFDHGPFIPLRQQSSA